jgi:glycerol-3-phosphate acyltransferase PlsY
VAIWLLVVAFWRYVSLGSITAAAAMPLLVYLFYAPGHAPPFVVSLGIIAIAILVIWKHRPNIERLLSGTENRMKLGR